jgi:hypothetical protein
MSAQKRTNEPDIEKGDIVTAVLVEAWVQSVSDKQAKRFLAMLDRHIEHQEDLAQRRVVRIRPSPPVDELTVTRWAAVERLKVIASLVRRLMLLKAE